MIAGLCRKGLHVWVEFGNAKGNIQWIMCVDCGGKRFVELVL